MTRKLCIAFILALAFRGLGTARARKPPANLAQKVAEAEATYAEARQNYTYRQVVEVNDFNGKGRPGGLYREVRDIIFSPKTGRSEKVIKGPIDTLRFLRLTEEDFRDIREVQPFLFTADHLWAYETRYRGVDIIDGNEYFLLEVGPRQVFQGQRYFRGQLWIHPEELAVVRSYGQAIPPVFKRGRENIFPHFTTLREKVDGKYWFPVLTHADDVLPFRTGPVRIRMKVRYSDYRRFSAESSITFEEAGR